MYRENWAKSFINNQNDLLLPFMQDGSFLNKAGHALRDLKKIKFEEDDST